MIISHIRLENWRNFRAVDAQLGQRVFVIGPNAWGKSNFLDAFRFLRDVAKPGGGLQTALSERGGLSKVRCLAARQYPDVEMAIEISNGSMDKPLWSYAIGIKQQTRGSRKPYLAYERVWCQGEQILSRPDSDDRNDEARLTQTHLEQVNANQGFREVAELLESVLYLHVVPRLVRHSKAFTGPGIPGDPFGRHLLERIARTHTEWLPRGDRHPNLIFRVAFREVEAWLLAHREAFAEFTGLPESRIPIDVESITDPKEYLIDLVASSRRRELREDVVPPRGGTARQGPNHNGQLVIFVHRYWEPQIARKQSRSLDGMMRAQDAFTPTWPSRPVQEGERRKL